MAKSVVEKNAILQDDILRYKKNKVAANVALLALVFNVLYFTLFYGICKNEIYTPLVGASVIVNLLVLLAGFYCSEGVKGYNKKFSYVLVVLAVVQVIRIFIYPMQGMANDYLVGNYYFGKTMTSASNGTFMIIYLAASAACFIVSAIHGYIVARRLEVFQAKLDKGEVSIEATLAELDAKEANNG